MNERSNPSLDGRTRRAQERRQRRAQQLRAAGERVFSDKGYRAATVADILSEAGIARGTFYLYYQGKREIFEELLEQVFAQISGALFRIRLGPGQEPALVQMLANVRGVMDVLVRNRGLTLILLREASGLDSDFDQKISLFYDRILRLIQGAIHLGQSMGILRPCDPVLVSYSILGSLKEVMLRVLQQPGGESHGLDAAARQVLDHHTRGLFIEKILDEP